MGETKQAPLTLRILWRDRSEQRFACDSVRLVEAPEGQRGVRRGHIRALIALGQGPFLAALNGETIFEAQFPGGLVSVERDVVTVFPAE